MLEVLFSFRVGGSEIVGLELAQQLSEAGAEVICTALDGMSGPLRTRCAELGIGVADLGLPVSNYFGRNGVSLSLARRLRELRLDVLHLQHLLGLNKLGMPARLARVPRIVVTEHSELPADLGLGNRVRMRLNSHLADSITVIHPGLREHLSAKLWIRPERLTVIPNGIDIARWHRDDREARRAELGIGGEFVFMFVGRLEPVKNVPALIRAFLRARDRFGAAARLVVVGDGTEMPLCRELLAGHPLRDAVLLAGEQSDIRRYLAAADAFVMNSHSEGSPRALLEAMCMELPAICPAVGEIQQLLDGRGWVTRTDDPDSLEAALADAVAHPGKGLEHGRRARAYVTSHYDQRKIIGLYQEALRI